MAKLAVRPYATAIFEIAKEQDQVKAYADQVKVVIGAIQDDKQFMELLLHPKIRQSEKLALMEQVFKDKVADEITGLFTIMINKGRQNILIDVLAEFLEMVNEDLGIIEATITSAVELNTKQLEQIKEKIQANTKKVVTLQTKVDESLIGGMIIRVGDNIVDASISGRIRELQEGLMSLQLA